MYPKAKIENVCAYSYVSCGHEWHDGKHKQKQKKNCY